MGRPAGRKDNRIIRRELAEALQETYEAQVGIDSSKQEKAEKVASGKKSKQPPVEEALSFFEQRAKDMQSPPGRLSQLIEEGENLIPGIVEEMIQERKAVSRHSDGYTQAQQEQWILKDTLESVAKVHCGAAPEAVLYPGKTFEHTLRQSLVVDDFNEFSKMFRAADLKRGSPVRPVKDIRSAGHHEIARALVRDLEPSKVAEVRAL
jgi:hypothetical protein